MSIFPRFHQQVRSLVNTARAARRRQPAQRRSRPELSLLEARDLPSATLPFYLNAPADVASAGVYIAISGKDPASTPTDQGEYFQFAPQPVNGVYSGNYTDLSAATLNVPLQALQFQSSLAPAGDSLPAGDLWVQVNLPNALVDSGQIIVFVGPNSPKTLPVVSSTSGGNSFYDISAPSPTTYPNNAFNLSEFSVVGAVGDTTSFLDISNVDSIGVPVTLQTTPIGAAPTNLGVGIQLSFGGIETQYKTFLANQTPANPSAADFQELQTPQMIVAPQHAIDGDSTTPPKLGLGSTAGGHLPASTFFYYEVTSVDATTGKESGPSSALGFATGAQASNDLSLLVAWPPIQNASKYNIYRAPNVGSNDSPSPGAFGLLTTLAAPATAFVDDGSATPGTQQPPPLPLTTAVTANSTTVAGGGLASGSVYNYEVAVVSPYGESTAIIFAQASLTPGQNAVNVTWSASTQPGVTGYNVYRATVANGTTGPYTLLANVSASTTSYTDDTGANPPQTPPAGPLVPPTVAVNVAGALTGTFYYEYTSVNNQGVESLPSLASAPLTVISEQILVNWNTVQNAVSYSIYRSDTGPSGPFDFVGNFVGVTSTSDNNGSPDATQPPSAPPPAPAAISSLAGATGGHLTSGDTYYYELTAITSSGQSLPSLAASLPLPAGDNSIILGWTASPGATAYKLYRSSSAGGPFLLLAEVSGATTYVDTGAAIPGGQINTTGPQLADPALVPNANTQLITGTNYYYEITATNSSGESFASNTINAQATAGMDLYISWPAFSNATGYNIYRATTTTATAPPPAAYTLYAQTTGTSYQDSGAGNTTSTQTPPANSYTFDPLSSYFTPDMVSFLETYASSTAAPINFTGTTTAGSNTIQSISSTTGLSPGQYVTGAGVPVGTTITAVNATSKTITLSQPASASGSAVALTGSLFQLSRDGFTYVGQTTTYQDIGSDGLSHQYVVFQLSTSGGASYSTPFKLNIYAPFFTQNYLGANPFAGSSVSFLQNYSVPPAPQWMTDGSQMPGSMVFGGSGVFNTGVDDPNAALLGAPISYIVPGTSINVLSDVENPIDAAFNRGIAVAVPNGQKAVPASNWADLPFALSATAGTTTGGALSSPGNQYNAYFYVITTVNSLGESPASNLAAAVWANGDKSATIAWNAPAPSDAPLPPTGFNIYRSTNLTGPWTLVNASPVLPAPASGVYSYTDLGGGTAAAPAFFYASGSNSNYYSAFLHQSSTLLPGNPNAGVSINGLAYGFAYDDQGGQSTTTVITNLQALQLNFEPLLATNPTITKNTASIPANAKTITISGSGFDPTAPGLNIVSLSSGSGRVIQATANTLTLTLDSEPTAGVLTASVNVNGALSADLQVATITPVLSQSTLPISALSTFTINGFGFDTTNPAVNDRIFLSSGSGVIIGATGTQLTIRLTAAPNQGALFASVTVDGIGSGSSVQVAGVAGVPTGIFVAGGEPQFTRIFTAFPLAFQALVTDSYQNPVPGVTVTFIAPASGPSGTFANGTTTDTEITNSQGIATASTFTANSLVGGPYVITAGTAGVATPADFNLTNQSIIFGADTAGAFDPATGTWYLRNSNSGGSADAGNFNFGGVGWIPVVGDWNGDGSTTIGVVDPKTMTWYLRNSNSSGAPDYVFQFGAQGWIPVAGDWDDTGHTGIGVFNPATATWYLRDQVSSGAPSIAPFSYGGVGWTPVAGDWNGDGKTTIGVVDARLNWFLRDSNSSGAPTVPVFQFGATGWTPVAGDWTGQGKTTIGAVDPEKGWYLRNSNTSGAPQITAFQYGASSWDVVAGQWDAVLPQLAAGGPAGKPSGAAPLTNAQLQFEVEGALARLQQAGVEASLVARLNAIQFSVGQLSGRALALSDLAANRVTVDANAEGYGWFVDSTPELDNEFKPTGGTLGAQSDSAAAGHMDLLTVVLHELGHFEGWMELDPTANPNALMALTLGTGTRRISDLDAIFADKLGVRVL